MLSVILTYLPLGTIFLLAILAGLVVPVLAMARPFWLVIGFCAVLVFFNSQTSGALDPTLKNTIYYRGSGFLYFPFVTWFLLGMLPAVIVRNSLIRESHWTTPAEKWFWALIALFTLHVAVGLWSGVDFQKIHGNGGLFPIVLAAMFFLILQRTVDSERKLHTLVDLLVFSIFCRTVYGLIRYAFLGGDPVNIYQNYEGFGTKVAFFDFHDSTLATFAVAYCSARLVLEERPLTAYWKLALLGCIGACTLTVLLSFHRASLVGLAAAILIVAWRLPVRRRLVGILGTVVVSAAGLWLLTRYRLQFAAEGTSGVFGFFHDFGKQGFGRIASRQLETMYAFKTAVANPILGVWSWGRYEGYGLWWQDVAGDAAYDTVHNGFLQMWLKGGGVGIAVVLTLFVGYCTFFVRKMSRAQGRNGAIAAAAFGAFLAAMPNFAIGMVMTQLRGLALIFLLMALTYAAWWFSRGREEVPKRTSPVRGSDSMDALAPLNPRPAT